MDFIIKLGFMIFLIGGVFGTAPMMVSSSYLRDGHFLACAFLFSVVGLTVNPWIIVTNDR
jgi:hypothetical protein